MLKNLRNNNKGVVFVTVLVIVIVSMVLAVSVLSLNISQVTSSEDELKSIQATALAEGGIAPILISQFSASPNSSLTFVETMGGTQFTMTADIDNTGSGPDGSNSVPLDIGITF